MFKDNLVFDNQILAKENMRCGPEISVKQEKRMPRPKHCSKCTTTIYLGEALGDVKTTQSS